MDMTSEVVAGVYLSGLPASEERSLENPNMPLNSPSAWESVFSDSLSSDSGITVSHDKALTYAPVWQAVSMISGDVAKLPLNIYRRRPGIGEDARELATGHPLSYIVRSQANEETNAITFWRRLMVHSLLWGNGYAFIVRNGRGDPVELVNLLPDRTRPARADGRLIYVTEVSGENGPRMKALMPDDVIHVEGLGYDGAAGCDPTHYARHSWGLGLAQEKFGSAFFKHGGRQGGILELPVGMPKPARDTVEEGFRRSYEGVDNPFRTVVLRDSAKFHAAQVSPQESQLVEATENQVRQVARWFNISPSKLGLSDSVSYNSKSEDNQNYLDSTLSIWLALIASACNCKLLSAAAEGTYFFAHNTKSLLRMNPLAQAQQFQLLIASRVINPNEARADLNMLPYEGGELYINPNTTAGAGSEREGNDTEESPPPVRSGEYLRTLFAITARAREKAKKPNAFIEWIDGRLAPFKAEYRGQEQFPFDFVESGLRKIAETTHEGNLLEVVNTFCLTLEDQWNAVTT